MGRKIEGYWDCPQCGKKANKGRFRYCQGCGRPRGAVEFYMIEKDNYVEDPDLFTEDPDWYCSYCKSLNSSKNKVCESCGSSQEESDKNYFQLMEEEKRKEIEPVRMEPEYSSYEELNQETAEYQPKEQNKPMDTTWNPKMIGKTILLPVLALIAIIGLFSFMKPRNATIQVVDKSWERRIEVMELKTLNKSNWADEGLPYGARLLYTNREFYKNNKVVDYYKPVEVKKSEKYIIGYEKKYVNLGNGAFEEVDDYSSPIYDVRYWTETEQEPVYKNVPVYKEKCYYEIDEWVHKSYEITSGTIDAPYWATIQLREKEKEGIHSETYKITGVDEKGKNKTYTLPYDDWNHIQNNDILTVKVSVGNIIEILSVN